MKIGKRKRYYYIVAIEQNIGSASEFGPQEGWGKLLRQKLSASLTCADVVEFRPTRNPNRRIVAPK